MNHEEYERMYRFEDRYWWFIARRNLIATLIKTHYGENAGLRILDVGCGTGAMLDELASFGSVTGADFAPEALAFCRARGDHYPLARADIRCLPFADNSFDVITAMDIIEHIDNDKAALMELHRVLKPGGRVFATVPAFQSLWSEHDEALHHYRRYTAPQFKDLFQRVGFTVGKMSYTITSLFPLIWTYRQISKRLPKRPDREKKADLVEFSKGVNAALLALCKLETKVVNKAHLPFGVSVACVAQKKAA
jgi:ubiquinone/menaquinone biosynthesis C-methylase UbiE